jgi:ATP-dependent DNA helicase RecQ
MSRRIGPVNGLRVGNVTAAWDSLRRQILRRDGHRCVACGKTLVAAEAHIHHRLPRASGGTDEAANLVSLCPLCHAALHPHLGAGLAHRLLQHSVLRLAAWLDRERCLAPSTRHLGAALRLLRVPAFRPGQLAVIEAALLGRSVLMVSPTGSGKSLAFQIPAVLTPGLCLVISPLKALMADQVSSLLQRGLPATFLNSDLGSAEKALRLELLARGAFKFLYLAPERFFVANDMEQALLDSLRPSFLVVDEAHCIDRWGQDFRPDYARLRDIRARLGHPPVLAFTATAGRATQARILASLDVPEAEAFVQGSDRPNIALLRRAVERDRRGAVIADLLRLAGRLGVKAMVFVPTRRIGTELVQRLALGGIVTPFFHGQLEPRDKQDLLQRFGGRLEPALDRMVCTNAFGLGIDIPDVRLVVHWQHPASPEDYWQEVGRAGRAGAPSVAVLLTDGRPNSHDIRLLRFMAERTVTAVQASGAERHDLVQDRQTRALAMQRLAFTRQCVRAALLDYLGEAPGPPQRSLAFRLVEWLLAQRPRKIQATICCDACYGRRRVVADTERFVCEALGAPDSQLYVAPFGTLRR